MIVAATPIDPPEGEFCWAFHVVNDGDQPIGSVLLANVSYEWGDFGNAARIGKRVGPIGPGEAWEIWRETATEVRTSLHLVVDERPVVVEFRRLYRVVPMVMIPVLGRLGLLPLEG